MLGVLSETSITSSESFCKVREISSGYNSLNLLSLFGPLPLVSDIKTEKWNYGTSERTANKNDRKNDSWKFLKSEYKLLNIN